MDQRLMDYVSVDVEELSSLALTKAMFTWDHLGGFINGRCQLIAVEGNRRNHSFVYICLPGTDGWKVCD